MVRPVAGGVRADRSAAPCLSVLLLGEVVVVLAVGPRTGEVDALLLAVAVQVVVDELAAAVGVQGAQGERQPRANQQQRLEDGARVASPKYPHEVNGIGHGRECTLTVGGSGEARRDVSTAATVAGPVGGEKMSTRSAGRTSRSLWNAVCGLRVPGRCGRRRTDVARGSAKAARLVDRHGHRQQRPREPEPRRVRGQPQLHPTRPGRTALGFELGPVRWTASTWSPAAS